MCGGKEKSASETVSLTKIVGMKNAWYMYQFRSTLASQHYICVDVTRNLDVHRQESY
jgi:hypothetical protein